MSRRLLAVVVVASPLFFWRLGQPGFSDTEGMFAEPAREMVATGDWVTPRMNGEPFLTKPPLMYWLSAALFTVTGPTEHARVWPALAGLGTVAATGAQCWRRLHRNPARAGGEGRMSRRLENGRSNPLIPEFILPLIRPDCREKRRNLFD